MKQEVSFSILPAYILWILPFLFENKLLSLQGCLFWKNAWNDVSLFLKHFLCCAWWPCWAFWKCFVQRNEVVLLWYNSLVCCCINLHIRCMHHQQQLLEQEVRLCFAFLVLVFSVTFSMVPSIRTANKHSCYISKVMQPHKNVDPIFGCDCTEGWWGAVGDDQGRCQSLTFDWLNYKYYKTRITVLAALTPCLLELLH